MEKPSTVILQMPAGLDSEGQRVLERIQACKLEQEGHYQVQQSPLFIRNLARGDLIALKPDKPAGFLPVQRSGNLAIRVFRKEDLAELELTLTPEVEKLDGSLDLQSERGLSYSLHVNLGFAAIETLFDNVMASFPGAVWYYGNVYDPADGISPLNWWDSFINQV